MGNDFCLRSRFGTITKLLQGSSNAILDAEATPLEQLPMQFLPNLRSMKRCSSRLTVFGVRPLFIHRLLRRTAVNSLFEISTSSRSTSSRTTLTWPLSAAYERPLLSESAHCIYLQAVIQLHLGHFRQHMIMTNDGQHLLALQAVAHCLCSSRLNQNAYIDPTENESGERPLLTFESASTLYLSTSP